MKKQGRGPQAKQGHALLAAGGPGSSATASSAPLKRTPEPRAHPFIRLIHNYTPAARAVARFGEKHCRARFWGSDFCGGGWFGVRLGVALVRRVLGEVRARIEDLGCEGVWGGEVEWRLMEGVRERGVDGIKLRSFFWFFVREYVRG